MPRSFYPSTPNSTNGVLSFLKKKKKLQKYVETFSCESLGSYTSSNILDINDNSFWASADEAQTRYVGFKLIKHTFRVFYYKISQYDGMGYMLKNWAFQGSNDEDETWEDIDTQNNESFCSVGIKPTITIPIDKAKEYKRFRIIQQGYSCGNSNLMRLAGIELFGELKGELAYYPCTNKVQRYHKIPSFILMFFLLLS